MTRIAAVGGLAAATEDSEYPRSMIRRFALAVAALLCAFGAAWGQSVPAPAPAAAPGSPPLPTVHYGLPPGMTAPVHSDDEITPDDDRPIPPQIAVPDSFPQQQPSGTTHRTQGADFAAPAAVLDLSSLIAGNRVVDPADASSAWLTVPVVNNGRTAVTRVIVAEEDMDASLALFAPAGRTYLREAAVSDSSVTVERASAFGRYAIRVLVPPVHSATLALHVANAGETPTIYAWTEAALIAHNRHASVLTGVVAGLLAAAAAFAAGAAAMGSRPFAKWAALFLIAVLFADLTATGVFDRGWLTDVGGPYGLLAFALAWALAAGLRLVDFVAPFEAYRTGMGKWRDRVALFILAVGAAALFNVPGTGIAVRALAVLGAALSAGYLANCGRMGVATARRLAPAATVFALVTAAGTAHALGLLPGSLVAPAAIGGFSAAGAMLVALACAVGLGEPAVMRLQALRDHRLGAEPKPDDAHEREHAAVAASHQGVFDLDMATGLLSLSAEAAMIVGLPPGTTEIDRNEFLARIHPEDRAVYQEAMAAYRQDAGLAFRLEFRAKSSGGRMRWFELRATMTGQASEAERCLGLIADVSGRKSLEAANDREDTAAASAPAPVSQPQLADAPAASSKPAEAAKPSQRAQTRTNGVTPPAAGNGASAASVKLDADLARAIEKGEIEVHYQPIMRMRDGTVGGFEALLRWTHPEHGGIPPDQIIPHAEASGTIVPVGRFVLRRAAEDLAKWQQFFPLKPALFVSVNVSWRQLTDETFFKDVEDILRETGVAPGSLKLELTEGSVMKDASKAEAALKRLKTLGAGLAIDDFGAGYSALAQLGRFPFDTIKIDKSFVDNARDKRGEALLVSVVTLAHELKFEIIAEGVEREQEARRLRSLAVEYAQGYIFGRPLPAGEVTGFVAMTYAG